LAILLLSGFIAYFAKKSASLKNVFESSLNILSVSAGAVIAIGLMVVGSGKLDFVLVNTVWILALAFVVKHLMLCYRPLVSLLSSVSESEIEAAVLAGVSTRQLPRKFFIPRLRAGLVSIFIFVFIPILGELSMSVFLVGPNVKTLGSVLFELHDYADQTSAMVLSLCLFLFSVN
jgi:iron(III) transport system permease protein